MAVEGHKGSIRERLWPDDFGERLERLMEMAGLSRQELAQGLGVTERTVEKWLKGGMPTGANYWGIAELARRVPGGMDLILFGQAGPEGEAKE